MSELNSDNIKCVLDALFKSSYQEKAEMADPEWKTFETLDLFHASIVSPFQRYIEGYVAKNYPDSDHLRMSWFLLNSSLIECNFQWIIKSREGHACCADKSRYLARAIFRFFTTGQKIVHNLDQEYTYHIPKTIFLEHDQIMEFLKALHNSWHGDYRFYSTFLKNLDQKK
jgi:hypothetical protein